MPAPTLRLLISGRVQGVGFRAFVAREARALGLSGYVRNLRDGRVETAFGGDAAAMAALREACGRGPSGARVTDVQAVEPGAEPLRSPFETLLTL